MEVRESVDSMWQNQGGISKARGQSSAAGNYEQPPTGVDVVGKNSGQGTQGYGYGSY